MAFETTSELFEYMQQLTGDRNPGTTTRATMLDLLDQAHKEVVSGGGLLNATREDQKTSPAQWSWLPRTTEIIALKPYEEYTITVTNDSTSATLSSAPSATRLDWFVIFDSSIYRIAANSGTSVTLDSACASTTGTYSAKVYKLDYELTTTDVVRLLDDPFRMSPSPKQIGVVSDDKISDVWLYNTPKHGLIEQIAFNVDTDNTATLRVSSISDRAQRVRLQFLVLPEELDLVGADPILPKQHRKMLAHLAGYYHLLKRDINRAGQLLATAKTLFGLMKAEDEGKYAQQGKWEMGKARLLKSVLRSGGRPGWMRGRN